MTNLLTKNKNNEKKNQCDNVKRVWIITHICLSIKKRDMTVVSLVNTQACLTNSLT